MASSASFIDFMSGKYDEIANSLVRKNVFKRNQLQKIKEPWLVGLHRYESFPSVLNHGDLSTKNVIIDEHGELTLIDWDDAMSYNWMADVARMTYWMKFTYDTYEYEFYRNIFLEHYLIDSKGNDFAISEPYFHVLVSSFFLFTNLSTT